MRLGALLPMANMVVDRHGDRSRWC